MNKSAWVKEKGRNGERFLLLDGLRGLAAICVMWFHFIGQTSNSWLESAHGPLGVDLFFLLSGFVICAAYEAKLLKGLTLGRFVIIRAIRLGPMLWLGVILAQILLLSRSLSHGDHIAYFGAVISTVMSLLSLPNVFVEPKLYFALLGVRWSLFFEMAINILYAINVHWLSNTIIIIIMCCAGITLVMIDPAWGSHGSGLPVSAARACFSFPLGILISRLYSSGKLIHIRAPAWLIVALVIFVCFVPVYTPIEAYFSAVSTFLLMPVILIAACYVHLGNVTGRAASMLGDISYPLYLLHRPVQFALLPVLRKLGMNGNSSSLVIMPLVLVLSLVVARRIDEPVRKWLSVKVKREKPIIIIEAGIVSV